MKCDDIECCAPLRSSLKTVIPGGFLPAPLPVSNNNGLYVAQGDEKDYKFLSLFQRMSMHLSQPGITQSTAYDSFCPTVMAAISNRTCNVCDLYFASHVTATHHKQAVHPKVKLNDMPKTRPVRVAAKRQRELMAIIAAGTYCWVVTFTY